MEKINLISKSCKQCGGKFKVLKDLGKMFCSKLCETIFNDKDYFLDKKRK